jgi:hypothetical protein
MSAAFPLPVTRRLDRATRGISCLPQERDADPIAILIQAKEQRRQASPVDESSRKIPSAAGARSKRLG